ncbi:Two-on-two hemoglobin-3 [Porphyridium purpureum]|uniref:Two-on-two hemoglobin-3 n=1 Tax=Porphyridium purpureum TaxID=35688 RepID=A0A5J4YY89_PORPP|nr:Two-on-two hemoglobin-3 [Porphyridium purpureum]|eukprot:POR5117..scf209_3
MATVREYDSYIQQQTLRAELTAASVKNMKENIFPQFYEMIGDEPINQLTKEFYSRVYDDQKLASVFSSSTRSEAQSNLFAFLTELLGGPRRYTELRGKYHRLVGRHIAYNIDESAARRWLANMDEALHAVPAFAANSYLLELLLDYFSYTAYWIVFGKRTAYMKPGQPSGGNTVDTGRIW